MAACMACAAIMQPVMRWRMFDVGSWVRWPLGVACLLASVALAGGLYQSISSTVQAARFPEPGRLIDIGGRRLRLNCLGISTGTTVVLESGLGDVLIEWERVQATVASFARVCSYDRAGYGGSDRGPMPRTSAQIAEDLHELLRRAGERPPFVLVGHSFGGYNVRVFNGSYPDEVAGLVLVDSTQEDQYQLLPAAWNQMGSAMLNRYRNQARWAPILIDLGVARAMLRFQGVDESYLILQTKYVKARASELENIRVSAEQARAAGHINEKPLIVLTAGKKPDWVLESGFTDRDRDEYDRVWVDELQVRLARLSKLGRRTIVPNAGHDIPADRPYAIVGAVRDLIRGTR